MVYYCMAIAFLMSGGTVCLGRGLATCASLVLDKLVPNDATTCMSPKTMIIGLASVGLGIGFFSLLPMVLPTVSRGLI